MAIKIKDEMVELFELTRQKILANIINMVKLLSMLTADGHQQNKLYIYVFVLSLEWSWIWN